MDRVSQQLTQRVKERAERYETPLPELTRRAAALQARVAGHLAKMGFVPVIATFLCRYMRFATLICFNVVIDAFHDRKNDG